MLLYKELMMVPKKIKFIDLPCRRVYLSLLAPEAKLKLVAPRKKPDLKPFK
ncbi:MAG: hypothetical protein ACXWE6_12370 [Nitrososphaeraceae archaeon]